MCLKKFAYNCITSARLVLVGVETLQVAGRRDDRFDCARAEIVVIIRAELLAAQFERGHNLLRERPRLREAEGEQRDFGDQRVVGHHHCHFTKQCLQFTGQLRAASVAGVLMHKY